MTQVLEAHAQRVADAVLAEEEGMRQHVVVALSGAHAYGFPSPDSDLDLKGIHLAPTRALLGLAEPPLTSDRTGIVQGVEIDYTSNELGGVLRGLVKGNGNYLERVLGRHLLRTSTLLDELAPLARAGLSKRYYRHYLGFARQQEQALAKTPFPTAKNVLYVLRTALTGAHLLRAGALQVDLTENMVEYGFSDALDLIEQKKAGERAVLEERTVDYWRARLVQALDALERANAASSLPEDTPNTLEVEAWLVDVRVRGLNSSLQR